MISNWPLARIVTCLLDAGGCIRSLRRRHSHMEDAMHRATLILTVLLWSPSLFAHHGAGSFDLSKTVSFTDVILRRADLINPHAWLYFDVVKEGRSERHRTATQTTGLDP